jgi:seryl-tRNA synthetase
MTDWTHKRLLEKLDRMQAQRDRLLAAIERLMACANEIPAYEDLVAILNDEDAPEEAKQQAEAFLSLMAAIEDVKYPLVAVSESGSDQS